MSTRTALGAADVDDAILASWLDADQIADSRAVEIEYKLDAMTTGGRWWVSGTAIRDGESSAFRVVVKLVQSLRRSPIFAYIPESHRELALATVPWQIEPDVYRAPPTLPDGLRLPRALGVLDLDEDSAVVWMEAVDHDSSPWALPRVEAAAEALGRLATSTTLTALADDIGNSAGPHQARAYWEGRLQSQFATAYRDTGLWQHPVLVRHVDDALRSRLMSLLDLVPALIEEIESLPLLVAHGDACPNNLLVESTEPPQFCLIDWGFFARGRLGFDLSQLVISEIDLGRRPAADLPDLQTVALRGFARGLADAGLSVPAPDLARAHAIQLAIASGVSAVPLEQLGQDPAVLDPLVRERMAALDHILTGVGL